jgi:diguanylate cyclase (GGDEF)-like protein
VLDVRRADERSLFFDPVHALAAGASHAEVLELIASGLGRGGEVLRPAFIASELEPATGRYAQLHAVRAPVGLAAELRSVLQLPGPWEDLTPGQLASVAADDLPPGLAAELRSDGYAGLRVGAISVLGEVGALLLAAEPGAVWHSGRWSPSMESHWRQLLELGTVAFERHRYQSRLVHAATHDPLTGLANRVRFFDELTRIARRSDVAVLYLDLDGFKAVNDALGHARGDEVLVEVGRRLQATVRPGDLVARLGGDEFAVAVGAPEPEHAADLAHRLATAVTTRLLDDERVDGIGVSIGVCHSRPGQSLDDLVRCADTALLSAKRLGRGRVVVAE